MIHWKTLTMSLTFKNPLIFLMYLPAVLAQCPGNATCVTFEDGVCKCPAEDSDNTIVIVAIAIGSVSLVILLGLIFYEYTVRRSIRRKEEERKKAIRESDVELATLPRTQAQRNGIEKKTVTTTPQQPTQQQRSVSLDPTKEVKDKPKEKEVKDKPKEKEVKDKPKEKEVKDKPKEKEKEVKAKPKEKEVNISSTTPLQFQKASLGSRISVKY